MCRKSIEFLGIPDNTRDVGTVGLLHRREHNADFRSVYQRYLEKILAEKLKGLNLRLEKNIADANTEISSLHEKLQGRITYSDSLT